MSRIAPKSFDPSTGIPKPSKAPKKTRKGMRRRSAKKVAHEASEEGKAGKAHMARVARLPCIICFHHGMTQLSRTTVHHVCHGRYSTAREDDMKVLPLCDGHHQGDFDTTKLAIHCGKEAWAEAFGEDHEYLDSVSDMLAGELVW